jgi:hypothetical protein
MHIHVCVRVHVCVSVCVCACMCMCYVYVCVCMCMRMCMRMCMWQKHIHIRIHIHTYTYTQSARDRQKKPGLCAPHAGQVLILRMSHMRSKYCVFPCLYMAYMYMAYIRLPTRKNAILRSYIRPIRHIRRAGIVCITPTMLHRYWVFACPHAGQ